MLAKRSSKSKDSGLKIRRINKKSERKQGGHFLRIKTDEAIKAHALFVPDPEADKNPGWIEYLEHYDKPNNQYVPCTEDDCYMCELGDSPSTRALSLWYFPDNDSKDRFKVLTLNGYLIRDFVEIEEEEGGVLGRRFRVKRLSDDGKYRVSPQTDKPLTKKEVTALLKEAKEMGIGDFEQIVLNRAKAALAKHSAVEAMTEEDDDDEDEDDEETTPKSRRGKAKDTEPDDDDDDEDDEDDDEDDSDDDDEDDEDDDEDDDSDDDDDDEDDDDDDEDDDDEDGEAEGISGQTYTVVSTKESDNIITVKMDGKNVKLYEGEGVDPDYDKLKKGVKVVVDAVKDDEGDWVLTSLKVKGKGK